MRRIVALFAVGVVLFGAGRAAADDSVLNKEGFWTVGRGEPDNTSCMASLPTKGGGMFILRAEAGEVWFAVGAKAPLRSGKTAELSTEAYSFGFTPSLSPGGVLMADGPLNERALAALRLARGLVVRLDGREVFSADVQGTGLEGALDAIAACAAGKSGWWGPGVGAAQVATAPEPEPVLNKEGFWAVAPAADPGLCTAIAKVDDHLTFALVAGHGRLGFGVGSDTDFKRGRKGRFSTDSYSFDFRPAYEDANYFYAADDLDSQAAFALGRAKTAKISIDGRDIVDMELDGTGHAQLLTDLAACARGEKGWWGEGAKRR